jgi:hypothetical protein
VHFFCPYRHAKRAAATGRGAATILKSRVFISQTVYFAALYSLEEVLEMSAVILFIHTLLGYLAAAQDQLVPKIKNVR